MSKLINKYYQPETLGLAILGFAVIAVAVLFLSGTTGSTAEKPQMSTPLLSCGGSGENYIDINVTAGSPTGAPAGFTIQWQTTGDYQQFGWPVDSSCPLDAEGVPTCGESFCKASFSGNSNSSNYSLGPGQSVTVRIGDLVPGSGVSIECLATGLLCGHNYVFRVFAHANSSFQRSDFTENLSCSTTDCPVVCDTNVHGLEFWRDQYPDAWPESVLGGLTIGGVTYTAEELEGILLTTPEEGDCDTILLQQVIVTNLNIANGANEEYAALVAETLAAADALLSGGEGDCASLANELETHRAEFECPGGE